jgi:hypothetical protein
MHSTKVNGKFLGRQFRGRESESWDVLRGVAKPSRRGVAFRVLARAGVDA